MPRPGDTARKPIRLQRTKRAYSKTQAEHRETYMAVVNGAMRVSDGYWVHDIASADANGNATYGAPYQLPIFPGASIDPRPNWKVIVKTFKGRDYIWAMEPEEMKRAGYSVHQTNALDPSKKFITLSRIADLKTFPRGDDTVRVEPGLYEKQDGTFEMYTAGAISPYIDILTEYVPASVDDSTIVCVWLDSYTNEVVLTQSSEFEQSATIFYTPTEALPYINEAAADRPPDAIGSGCYLVNGDTTVMDMTTLFYDLRPFLHSPPGLGLPNPITRKERIWEGRQAIWHGELTISGTGELTTLGESVVL